jgi:hypothetical protein
MYVLCVSKPSQSRFAERILVVSNNFGSNSKAKSIDELWCLQGGRDTVTIRLDFSLYPRAPKAAPCTAQSLPLTMDSPQVFHDDIFDGFPRERIGADDICSPPQLSELRQPDTDQGTRPEQWSSAAAAKPCEVVDFATDVDLIAHTGGAEVADECLFEHVPLFERTPRLRPLYAHTHVAEQAEPSLVVATASPKGSSAVEQVRTCASSVVCLPKPFCTCKWEWLPDELPEVTPNGDHAQGRKNDDEGEATASTSEPSHTSTWMQWLADDMARAFRGDAGKATTSTTTEPSSTCTRECLPDADDLPEVTTKVNSTNKRKRKRDQGEESWKGTRRMRLWR